MDQAYYCLDSYLSTGTDAILEGTFSHTAPKTKTTYIYLEDVTLQLKDSSREFSFSDFLVLTPKQNGAIYQAGNRLQITGQIQAFQTPSSPGQFNERAYYKEMNLYYRMQAESIARLSDTIQQPKKFLYDLRNRILQVYKNCMEEKEAGVISAMLLGEKSLLDADIKSLYQINGIGHILAISGLHITILCTLIYKLTFLMHFPRLLSFSFTIFFLFGYGSMTGFGISTNRAVIMMLLSLLAREIGRSYEPLSAMAFSAICILLQKPYALFSSSFLLSYGAAAGICLIFPVLKTLVLGTKEKQMAAKRRRHRREKEMHAYMAQRYGKLIPNILLKSFLSLPFKLLESCLLSLSVWIAVLPVTLYFFYEIPTYGILLNLFILPFVSLLVALSLAGGILGLFCLPVAHMILSFVTEILKFYETLCNLFLKLPHPVQVLGCPSLWQIVLYYILLLFAGFLIVRKKPLTIVLGILAFFLLLYRPLPDCLQVTMLDVGQGDGIFLQTENGKTMLIDGGSTSESQIGKYRILPYLKYYGIRKIDYLLMTHPDEDHISGQQELIESMNTSGVSIGCYFVPKLWEQAGNSNYQYMIACAKKAGIPIYYITAGNTLSLDAVNLQCLHPEENFTGSSANAGSITLSLTCGSFSMLLTGDLEAEGEEAVLQKLQKEEKFSAYTVLKVAHHGSRNSTNAKFLKAIKPQIALISCGETNRYGHPHKEVIERLSDTGCNILTTPGYGTITIEYSHKGILELSGYRNYPDTGGEIFLQNHR